MAKTQGAKMKIMTVKFFPNDKGSPMGKLADAELHFSGGPLDGFTLIGFAMWERKSGGRNVTFPARQDSVNGERRSFALLRPIADATSQDRLRDIVLEAYKEHEAALAEAVKATLPERGTSAGGRIQILDGISPAEEFVVLVHEYAHELLHRADDQPASRDTRELEAEAVRRR